jgi:peptide deformylase
MSDNDEILRYGHSILRRKAAPVSKTDSAVTDIADRLTTCLERAGGLGLAAPQIGSGLCVIAYDIGEGCDIIINPRIEESDGLAAGVEGCLSLPRLYGDVPRAERVIVKGLNRRGRPVTIEAQDLLARVLQHEIDHLDGILFVDRIDPETLHWLVGDAEQEGEPQRVYTTLEDALKLFEARAASRRRLGE